MNVNAAKHQAKLLEWKGRVADCRSSGMSVKDVYKRQGIAMYRFHDACFGFMRMRYWCVSQLWRGRIKIVSAGA